MSHTLIGSIVSLYPLYKTLRADIKELVGPHMEHVPQQHVSRETSKPAPRPAFRQRNPHGRLLCQLVHLDEQQNLAVYRCTAVDDAGHVATAYGYGSSHDPECAEAESIKKALLELGYDH